MKTALAVLGTVSCLCVAHPVAAQPSVPDVPPDRAREAAAAIHAPLARPTVSIGGVPTALDALLRRADEHGPAVRVASAEVELARAEQGAATPLLPDNATLQLGLGQRRATSGGTAVDAEVQLLQPIEIGGQRRLRREVAAAARLSRERSLERVRWELHQRVHATYRLAIATRERAALTQQLAQVAEQLLDIARRRARANDVAPLVVRIAEAEAAQARQRAVAALQDYRSVCLQLAELSGWEGVQPPEPVGDLPSPQHAPSLQQLMDVALEHNVDLRQLRAENDEALSRARLAARDAYPDPAIGVQYGYEGATQAGGAQHIVMGVLQLPIPSFALNQEGRARADAQQGVAEAQRDARAAVLVARIERLRTSVDAAAERVEAFGSDVLPRFSENLSMVREAFALGEYDILRVSVALERFLAVQQQALDAYVDYFNAVAELELQLGREIWPDEEVAS
ncbi:MAG: TolC family protein [Sandaracinaceae bacterium]|nr:TolC family protein [Sandaracinaceae bacterium]